MAPKKKTKKKPLTISIHGEDLDIEATFSSKSRLDIAIADVIKRVQGAVRPGAKTTAAAATETPLAMLLQEFSKSLRKDQVEILMGALDMSQKILFMEIANLAAIPQPQKDN